MVAYVCLSEWKVISRPWETVIFPSLRSTSCQRSPSNSPRCTPDGEIAEKEIYTIDTEVIAKEEAFDGFYAVCTNLEDDAAKIIIVNNRRWEIEECFRIMKSEFKARPCLFKP